jgi:uncharacterized membrane protein
MSLDPIVLIVIIGMGIATYGTRIAGYLLLSGRQFGPRMTSALEALPPAVLTAVIAPAVLLDGGAMRSPASPEIIAAIVTGIAALRLPFLAVIIIGTGSVVGLRMLMG